MKRCSACFKEYENESECPHCGYVDGTPPEELSHLFPGTVLYDRYIIGKSVGFGGFGITYRAWDKKLDMLVAIKEYYPSGIVNRIPGTNDVIIYAKKRTKEFDYGKERFLDEARNMAKFSSEPNIINVFEFFEENSTAYIVMEFLDGISLSKFIHSNEGKVDVEQGLDIARSIGSALCRIHEKDIIHRDVSPDNIFLCFGGGIKLIDFGAARFSQDESKLMTIILKPGFAPPEQYEKINEQGPWTDVYALGATLYYVLTGVKPEESTNRKIKDTVPYPHTLESSIPENLSNCIMKAMSIDLKLRFPNVEEFLKALGSEKAIVPIEKEKKSKKAKRLIGIGAIAAVLVGGILYGTLSLGKEKSEETLPTVSIEMWYCKNNDALLDKGEENSYKALIEDFNSSFSNVTITLKAFESSEYEQALSSAENRPAIYEYMGTYTTGKTLSLDPVYSSENAKKCSMLKNAKECFTNQTLLPLGFDAPVIFENTSLTDLNESVGSLEELSAKGNVLCDNNDFSQMSSESEKYFSDDAQKRFCLGEIPFYASTTDSYDAVAEALPGRFKLLSCGDEKVICRFDNLWAASDIGNRENKASLRLLEYICSMIMHKMHYISEISV